MRKLMLAATMTLAMGCDSGSDTDGTAGDVGTGGELYTAECSSCHGVDGSGGTSVGIADTIPGYSDDELKDIVQNGTGSMAAVAMTDDEVVDLIAFLRDSFDAQ